MAGDDIVFQFDIQADLETVRRCVATAEGVSGWWTDSAEVEGDTATLTFPGADRPYDFAVVEAGHDRVVWATNEHPPGWRGTQIAYEFVATPEGSLLFFRHGGFPDDPSRAIPAFIWGQIMPRLKGFAETGTPMPFFTTR